MNAPCWSTAANSPASSVVEADHRALGAHLHQCWVPHQRVFALRCAAESVSNFAAARFVSSLLVFAAGLALLWLLL